MILSGCSQDKTTQKETKPNDLIVHDFGVVLSDGGFLEHSFEWENASRSTYSHVKGLALRSCCSGIGALAESVPPGRTIPVKVGLKTIGLSGPIQADFAVSWRECKTPQIFRVMARVIPACDVVEESGDSRLLVGHGGFKRLLIVDRRLDTTSPVAASISSSGGIRVDEMPDHPQGGGKSGDDRSGTHRDPQASPRAYRAFWAIGRPCGGGSVGVARR